MFKTRKMMKHDNAVLYKDNNAKAAQILSLESSLSERSRELQKAQKEIKELKAKIKDYGELLKSTERDALEATEKLKRQEHNNSLLQSQMTRKSCEGCIHSANYRKCTSCARYSKLKDKWEAKE